MKKHVVWFLLFVMCSICTHAQSRKQTKDSLLSTQDSRHGYILPVNGHIHILLVFAEVVYDNGKDPCPPEGTKGWPAGGLPVWKDSLFDPFPSTNPRAIVSRFFYEASFGNYLVTGDYLINPQNKNKAVQIQVSQRVTTENILAAASSHGSFSSQNGFAVQDFDKWTLTHTGHAKQTPSLDSPLRYDHVMIIIRNSTFPTNLSGWTASRSPGRLFGYESDTYSFFCTHDGLPFNILLHEYAHMMFGGNNFHAGGSHSKKAGYSYFPHLQGGWGMMGAAWKSFLTANAWERRRLGWKPQYKKWYISCLDSSASTEIISDLDANNLEDQGIYLLRDFVTTGDAIRIKLPFLPDDVFQQWIWIENHATKRFNNSPFDVFQYESADCMDKATAGLYVYMQVDKEEMSGRDIFGGYADYLRPLPANGLWDFVWDNASVQNPWCINNSFYHPHSMQKNRENPFSGSHEMELVYGDFNNNGKVEIDEYRVPAMRRVGGNLQIKLPMLGASEHAFTIKNNKHIGIGTNPSTAPLITTVSASLEMKAGEPPNNRTVYLNGISIEIINRPNTPAGAVFVKIRFDDHNIRQSTRWCADTIVLPQSTEDRKRIIALHNGSTLHIDRGLTPTRLSQPDTVGKHLLFTKPTIFIVESNAGIHLKPGTVLKISNGSIVIFKKGSTLIVEKKSQIILANNSRLIFEQGAVFQRNKKCKIKVDSNSKIVYGK
jgi:hypothetical protein